MKFASVTEMAFSLKHWLLVLFVFLISFKVLVRDADAAGECGRTAIRSAAASLSPCLVATGNEKAKVPPTCCSKVGALLKTSPRCLCAILLSPLAKQAGIKPGIAIGLLAFRNDATLGTDKLGKNVEVAPLVISLIINKFMPYFGFGLKIGNVKCACSGLGLVWKFNGISLK